MWVKELVIFKLPNYALEYEMLNPIPSRKIMWPLKKHSKKCQIYCALPTQQMDVMVYLMLAV